jgi:hypothetical protein
MTIRKLIVAYRRRHRNAFAPMSHTSPCAELAKLQLQYKLALRAWAELEFTPHNVPFETEASRIARAHRKQHFLNARNAAAFPLSDHKMACLVCRTTQRQS